MVDVTKWDLPPAGSERELSVFSLSVAGEIRAAGWWASEPNFLPYPILAKLLNSLGLEAEAGGGRGLPGDGAGGRRKEEGRRMEHPHTSSFVAR